jgi:hypothetical protein
MSIPIVLGVTGHRLLPREHRGQLCASVAAILEEFAREYPGTPLVLLSSLAPGGDQLAAQVALEKGHRVIAPLPVPEDVYLASTAFQPQDSDGEEARQYLEEARQTFTRLLADRARVEAFVVPFPGMPVEAAGWHALVENEGERRRCYANAGGYVALHAHALIALWDGELPAKPAGTGEMVLFKLTGQPPASFRWDHLLLPWADTGRVFVIHTPRDGSNNSRTPGERYTRFPCDAGHMLDPSANPPGAEERARDDQAVRRHVQGDSPLQPGPGNARGSPR